MVQETLRLAARANVAFVGVGHIGSDAPLVLDGFVSSSDLKALKKAGAVGEIVGWVFDGNGRVIEGLTNERVASAPLPSRDNCEVIAVAAGASKVAALIGALRGRLVSSLITDESTAELLLGARGHSIRSAGRT